MSDRIALILTRVTSTRVRIDGATKMIGTIDRDSTDNDESRSSDDRLDDTYR